MTHHPIRTLPDGTRVYSRGQKYKPMADEERTNKVRKPDDPRAVRFHGQWYLPLELLPDEERRMPATRPDSDAYDHCFTVGMTCMCDVCRRPEAAWWRNRYRIRVLGLRSDGTLSPYPPGRPGKYDC